MLDDVREDSALNPTSSSANGSSKANAKVNGSATTNGTDGAEKPSLAVPEAVVEEALRATRESLEAVCEIEEKSNA